MKTALLMALAAFALGAETSKMSECTAGSWRAWVDSTLAGDPRARAQTRRMEVFRRGPADEAPVKLYELTSTGGLALTLRDDGVLMVQSGGPPRFYFPGETEARTIVPAAPKKLIKNYAPHETIGKAYFLGGVLFYERIPYPSDLMIGFIEVDGAAKSFGRNVAVVEVRNSIGGAESWAASFGSEPILVKDHIFWVNRGQSNIEGVWRKRRLWALELRSGRLMGSGEIPAAVLEDPPERLAELIRLSSERE